MDIQTDGLDEINVIEIDKGFMPFGSRTLKVVFLHYLDRKVWTSLFSAHSCFQHLLAFLLKFSMSTLMWWYHTNEYMVPSSPMKLICSLYIRKLF